MLHRTAASPQALSSLVCVLLVGSHIDVQFPSQIEHLPPGSRPARSFLLTGDLSKIGVSIFRGTKIETPPSDCASYLGTVEAVGDSRREESHNERGRRRRRPKLLRQEDIQPPTGDCFVPFYLKACEAPEDGGKKFKPFSTAACVLPLADTPSGEG